MKDNQIEEIECITEKVAEVVNKANKAALEVSDKTFFSNSAVQGVPQTLKAAWLEDEVFFKAFHKSFEELKTNEKAQALHKTSRRKTVTVAGLLLKQKQLIEDKIRNDVQPSIEFISCQNFDVPTDNSSPKSSVIFN